MKKLIACMQAMLFMLCWGSAQAVGVIGGADGPTAIIVASTGGWWQLGLIAALILAVLAGGIVLLKKKKHS